jgi:hypothetical protein
MKPGGWRRSGRKADVVAVVLLKDADEEIGTAVAVDVTHLGDRPAGPVQVALSGKTPGFPKILKPPRPAATLPAALPNTA